MQQEQGFGVCVEDKIQQIKWLCPPEVSRHPSRQRRTAAREDQDTPLSPQLHPGDPQSIFGGGIAKHFILKVQVSENYIILQIEKGDRTQNCDFFFFFFSKPGNLNCYSKDKTGLETNIFQYIL